jgi:hypothetical protein
LLLLNNPVQVSGALPYMQRSLPQKQRLAVALTAVINHKTLQPNSPIIKNNTK